MTAEAFKFSCDLDDTPTYCGLDVHKHELAAAVFAVDDAGCEFLETGTFGTTPAQLDAFWAFARKYRPVQFAMEATGVYHHVVANFLAAKRWEVDWGFAVKVVNPADPRNLPGKPKFDRVDAERLARYLSAGLLEGSDPVAPPLEDLKAIFRLADRLETERTALKNRVKKVLDRAGVRPRRLDLNLEWTRDFLLALADHEGLLRDLFKQPRAVEPSLARHARSLARNRHYFEPYLDLALTPTQQALLRQELVTLDFVTARKDLLAVEVDKVVSARPGLRQLVHHLATIPGISAFSAAWIVAETGPFARFHNVGQFLSYCGLCPRVVSSAGKTYSAHLTRRSNKYLRSIFFRAAGVVCNFVKKDSALKRYATRVVKRKGRYSWKLACCIVAAKVARVAFAIVKKRVPFSPSGGTGALSARVRRGFSVTDRKTLRRARNCLRRVKRVETLGQDLTEDVESLAKALDAALGQKD